MNDEPIPRADRLDPDGRVRSSLDGFKALGSAPKVANALGIDDDLLAEAEALAAQGEEILTLPDRVAKSLSQLGWPPLESSNSSAYLEAAELADRGQLEEADDVIVESWNSGDGLMLRRSVQDVQALYRISGSEYPQLGRPDFGHERALLIMEAFDCHVEERYAAAIALTLSQIEGITFDFSEEGTGFFSRQRGKIETRSTLVDETTFAGHPDGLRAIALAMTEQCKTTELEGRLVRHGILHGRELRFGTRANSTKALVYLHAMISFFKEPARRRLEQAIVDHETEFEASDQIDEFGRRLFRHGFKATKSVLTKVDGLQGRDYAKNGRYSGSLEEIFPRGIPEEFASAQIRVSSDRQAYWAWIEVGGFVLGVGRSNPDDIDVWRYADPAAPESGPGPDTSWRDPMDPEMLPDWGIG